MQILDFSCLPILSHPMDTVIDRIIHQFLVVSFKVMGCRVCYFGSYERINL